MMGHSPDMVDQMVTYSVLQELNAATLPAVGRGQDTSDISKVVECLKRNEEVKNKSNKPIASVVRRSLYTL